MSTETFFVRLCAAQSFRHYVSLSLCTFYRHNWPILWFITWKTAPKTRIIHLQDVVIRFVIDRDLLHIRANVFRNSEYVFLSFLSAFSSTSRTFSKRKTYQRLLWSKRKGEAFEKTSPNNKRDRLWHPCNFLGKSDELLENEIRLRHERVYLLLRKPSLGLVLICECRITSSLHFSSDCQSARNAYRFSLLQQDYWSICLNSFSMVVPWRTCQYVIENQSVSIPFTRHVRCADRIPDGVDTASAWTNRT